MTPLPVVPRRIDSTKLKLTVTIKFQIKSPWKVARQVLTSRKPEAEIPSFEHKEIKRFHSIDFDLNMHLKHLHFLTAAPRATIDRDCPIFKSRQKRRKAGKFIAMTFRLSLHGTTQLIGHPPRWRRSANVVKFLFLVLFPHEENERKKKNCSPNVTPISSTVASQEYSNSPCETCAFAPIFGQILGTGYSNCDRTGKKDQLGPSEERPDLTIAFIFGK